MAIRGLEYTGEWWLPDHPDMRIEGSLTSEDGILALNLAGPLFIAGLQPGQTRFITGNESIPVIFGNCYGDLPVTLLNARNLGMTFGQGFMTERYVLTTAYVGIHDPDPDAISVTSASVTYTYLLNWLGQSGFENQYEINEHYSYVGRRMSYVQPPPEYFYIDGGQLRITYSFSRSNESDTPLEVKIIQSVELNITVDNPIPLTKMRSDFLETFSDMLTVAVSRKNDIVRIIPYQETRQIVITRAGQDLPPLKAKNGEDTIAQNNIIVLGEDVIFNNDKPTEEKESDQLILPEEMLFDKYSIDNQDIGGLFARWLKVRQELSPLYSLFVNLIRVERQSREEFLRSGLVALRAYYAKRFSDNNRSSLAQKIVALVDLQNPVHRSLFSNRRALVAFSHMTIAVSDYLLGQTKSAHSQAVKDEQVGYVFNRLHLLLMNCLLTELGINEEKRQSAVNMRKTEAVLFSIGRSEPSTSTSDSIDREREIDSREEGSDE